MRLEEIPPELEPGQETRNPSGPEPILVTGRLDNGWLWVGVVFTFALIVFAALLYGVKSSRATGMAVLAVFCGLLSGGAFVRQWTRRRWVMITPRGVVLSDSQGDREIGDAEIRGLAFARQWQHSFGRLVAEIHRVRLWVGNDEEPPLDWSVRSAIGEPSPLNPLIRRVKGRLLREADEQLRRGIPVTGDGWSWTAEGLLHRQGGRLLEVPVREITSVDQNFDELRIWRNTEPLPAIRLPLLCRDVWLLGSLLQRQFGRPGDPGVPAADGKGRVLREHRPRSAMIAAGLLGLFAACVAGVCFAAAFLLPMLPLALVGVGVAFTAIALASTTLRLSRAAFRLHETGVSQTSLSGDVYLPFSEIDQFVFDARRQYSRGRYLGMVFTLIFLSQRRPRDGIFHTERAPFETEEILQIRDRVAEESARRMTQRWLQEGSVQWTPELTILQHGIRYQGKRRFLGGPAPLELPLSEIGAFDVVDGWFLVWGIEHDKPLIRVRTSAPNFYPGLLLFEQIDANYSVC